MKQLLSRFIRAVSLGALLLCSIIVFSQNTFLYTVDNLTQTATDTLEFDVYLQNTDVTSFEVATLQLGFTFNAGIYAGGTISAAIDNTGTGLNSAQQFTATPNTATPGVIKLAGKSPPGCGGGTVIPSGGEILLTHFTLASSIPFVSGTTPNLAFCSSTATSPLYPTKVSQYVSCTNTALVVTSGVNAIVIKSWLGNTSTDWSVVTNWSDGVVPTSADNITISSYAPNQPHVTSSPASPAECNAINVLSGATLTIDPGKALTAYGNTTVSGTFIINSDATGTGSFIDNGTVIGNVNVKKYLPTGRWWYIGSPVTATTALDAYGSISGTQGSGIRAHYWNEPTHGYVLLTDGYNLQPMQGYAFQDYTAPNTASYIGNLNTGTFGGLTNLTFTNGYKRGYNLVSNPFPSAINFDVTHTGITATDLETTFWYKSGVNYPTYNYFNGVSALGGQPVIPAMQAFWMRVDSLLSTTTGGLQIDNTARLHSSQTFFKTTSETNLFRMESSNGITNDEMVVGFFADALDIFENNDSRKMTISNADFPQVYSLTADAVITIINGQPELSLTEDRIIPVGFSTSVAGTFSFIATNLNEFDANIHVYLEDRQTSILQDLRQINTYTFTSGVVDDANRFKLHFGNIASGISSSTSDPVNVYNIKNTVYVNIPEYGSGLIELYDMVGNKILSKQSVQGLNTIQANVSSGIYLVKVYTVSKLVTKKIIISK